ncbi:MAG: amidohydrolase family protein [Halobacteriales archaeon]|nr:amidohydrolase family protein [Halobacteriales archaeon]
MADQPDLVVRNAHLRGRESPLDIVVDDGRIRSLEPEAAGGDRELDAAGRLVSPGLVDAHVHLDMAFSAGDGRRPRYNDGPTDLAANIEATAAYFDETPESVLEERIERAVRLAAANGVVHLRSHTYVDGTVGARVVRLLDRVRERLDHLVDLQLVSFPQRGIGVDAGSLDALRSGLEAGADLVGGLDPHGRNGDRAGTIEAWFDLAVEHGVGVDVHLHERGEAGIESLERLAAATRDRGLEGRVAASHAFALADAGESERRRLLESLGDAGVGVVTCYQSTPPSMPIRAFDAAGQGMAHGTDQVRTLWSPHGNADALGAMLVESLRLDTPGTNDDLAALWRLITANGARVMGLEGYGIEPDTPADLVVHDARSPEWAILTGSTPAYVVKAGRVVAEDGAVADDVN